MRSMVSTANGGRPPLAPGAGACGAINDTSSAQGTTTLWDTSSSAVVLHKKWGVFRALACTAAVFVVLILISALNAAGK